MKDGLQQTPATRVWIKQVQKMGGWVGGWMEVYEC